MQITLYENFSKRSNSTLQPSVQGTVIDCFLKQSTSVNNPVFILTVENFNISYVKWDNRFYFVNDIKSVKNGVVEISCKIDVLATYKTSILNTSAFVQYSTSNFNSDILDSRIGNTGTITQSVKTSTNIETFSESGCYCLTVIGDGGGQTEQRFVTRQGLGNLALNVSQLSDDNVINSLVLKFGSVFGCITGCTYLPFNLPSGTHSLIKIGDYTTGTDSIIATALVSQETKTVDIPWIYENPRRMSESLSLYIPCVGNVPLDTSQFLNDKQLTIYCTFDYVVGEVIYLVTNGKVWLKFNTQCGTPIQFAYTSQSRTSGIANTIYDKVHEWAMSGIDRNNANMDSVVSWNENFANSVFRIGTNYNVIGSNGSYANGLLASQRDNIVLTSTAFNFTETQSNMAVNKGRPYMRNTSLSQLTGYCQCVGASVSVSCEENERREINSYLNNGFYIE